MTLNVAYVAGVIDARGHLRLEMRHGKEQPRIAVTTRKISLLTVLSDLTGTKISMDDRGYQKRPCSEHCKDQHVHVVRQSAKWRVDCVRATVVLYNCLPFMVAQRDDALALLRVGLDNYQPSRNGTAAAMQRLGWDLPTVGDTADTLSRT